MMNGDMHDVSNRYVSDGYVSDGYVTDRYVTDMPQLICNEFKRMSYVSFIQQAPYLPEHLLELAKYCVD